MQTPAFEAQNLKSQSPQNSEQFTYNNHEKIQMQSPPNAESLCAKVL